MHWSSSVDSKLIRFTMELSCVLPRPRQNSPSDPSPPASQVSKMAAASVKLYRVRTLNNGCIIDIFFSKRKKYVSCIPWRRGCVTTRMGIYSFLDLVSRMGEIRSTQARWRRSSRSYAYVDIFSGGKLTPGAMLFHASSRTIESYAMRLKLASFTNAKRDDLRASPRLE